MRDITTCCVRCTRPQEIKPQHDWLKTPAASCVPGLYEHSVPPVAVFFDANWQAGRQCTSYRAALGSDTGPSEDLKLPEYYTP